jgi:threonine/homoserine/homoserine lactone efflux protein
MNSLYIFLQAIVVGFAIAAPVGPIGVLCIKRTLSSGFLAGLATGFGASFAGSVYAAIIAFGITALTALLTNNIFVIKLVGGALLVFLGIQEMRTKVSFSAVTVGNRLRPLQLITTAFFIALANPMTLLGYLGLVPALAAEFCCTPAQAATMICGLFTGSMLWWISLSGLVSSFRHRLSDKALQVIGISSGIVLIGFGLFVFISALIA